MPVAAFSRDAPTQVQTPGYAPTQPPAPAPPPPQYPAPSYPQPYAPPGYPQYPQYQQPYGYPGYQAPVQPTSLPLASGVLLVVAGILGMVSTALSFLVFGSFGFVGDPFFGALGTLFLICGIVGITFSAFAIIGGVMAMQKRMWGLALTGSILGLFIIGPVGISSILSLVALILIIVSHREFKAGTGGL